MGLLSAEIDVNESIQIRESSPPSKMIQAIEDTQLLSQLFREAVLTDSVKTFKQKLEQSWVQRIKKNNEFLFTVIFVVDFFKFAVLPYSVVLSYSTRQPLY